MTNTTLEKWEEKTLHEVLNKVKYTSKIQSKLYKDKGKYPIISQEDVFISGYWDNPSDVYHVKHPIVIFGDHTKVVKYIDFDFVLGADGVKILDPTKNINAKFLYYWTKYVPLRNLGYARHYKLLSEKTIHFPPLPEQERIVAKLDKAFEAIDKVKANAEQNLNNVKELFESALNKVFTENTEGWEEKTLKEVCKKISAGGDKPENFSKVITENCEVPIYSNGIENDGLYGYTDVPAITEEAITISARGTIGFICKRVKPYYPIVRLISAIPNDHINIDFMEYALKFMVPTGNGSSIPQLTVPMLKDKKVKYPSLPEQQKIVEKLDALQEQTKQLEAIYTQKIKECDELKQPILQKAFRGEL